MGSDGKSTEGTDTDARLLSHGEREDPDTATSAEGPDWWHRDHPTFVALVSFYTGVAAILLIPALWGTLLRAVLGAEEAERLFWWVALVFLVPVGLIAVPRTRRAGSFLLLGMVITGVVVVGVASAVLWVMMR